MLCKLRGLYIHYTFSIFWSVNYNFFYSLQLELQYLHDYAGISSSVGLTANPIINFSGVVGTNTLAIGADVSFDTKLGVLNKCNVGLNLTNTDLITSLTL